MKPCLDCGEVTEGSRCAAHTRERERASKGSAKERGYGYAWDKLSRRARQLQPWCLICGSPDDLQTDHTPEAWARKAAGKSIRLRDVRVLCGFHNREAGAARGPRTRGIPPSGTAPRPEVEAKSRLHTEAESQSDGREPPLLIDAPGRNVLDAEPSAGREAQTLATAVENRQDCVPVVDFVPGLVAGVRLDLAVAESHAEIRHDRSLP